MLGSTVAFVGRPSQELILVLQLTGMAHVFTSIGSTHL